MTNTQRQLDELMKYAKLDGTEWGEAMMAMYKLYSYRAMLSEDIIAALEKEINDHHRETLAHCQIVQREEISTTIVQELEWD